MTHAHAYHSLPATLRGNALEDRNWPKVWTAPDSRIAQQVASNLAGIIDAGGLGEVLTVTLDGVTVTVDREA